MSARRIIAGAWAVGAVFVGFVGLAAIEGCRAPTQMTLDISYRGGMCGKAIAVLAGDDPHAVEAKVQEKFYAAQTSTCDASGHVGTLVLTPKDASGRGAVLVIAGISTDPSTCTATNGYAGCVVARRAFAFAEHTSLSMPIVLDFECENVPCSETSSCKNRQCVSSQVSCNGDVCGDFGVAPDGGAAVEPDAPTTNEAGRGDATTDGPRSWTEGGMEGGNEGGSEAGVDGGACKVTSGVCPPYSGQSTPLCTSYPQPGAMPMKCRWDGTAVAQMTSCVPRFASGGGGFLYDQVCTSQRDCPPGNHCCSINTAATCQTMPCVGVGAELCVEDCDCPGTTCTLTPGGFTAPPFIKTCSQTATHGQ